MDTKLDDTISTMVVSYVSRITENKELKAKKISVINSIIDNLYGPQGEMATLAWIFGRNNALDKETPAYFLRYANTREACDLVLEQAAKDFA